MEEELNDHDLEDRLYAMLHHVDETEGNLASNHSDGFNILENAPSSTVRRYWRTSEPTNPYQKVNVHKDPIAPSNNNKQTDVNQTNQTPKPKEEKRDSPPKPPAVDLSIFQSPVPHNFRRTIEIIEQDDEKAVLLESSDEDEVIEVALPPKPTITIESSDEDELHIINPISPAKKQVNVEKTTAITGERDISASPAPSAVSSVSDEFIRGDCIALNISSRHLENPSFDFSLHGSDLLGQSTPSKKKKKKRTKEVVTSTPVVAVTPNKATPNDECFATPKSKAKNKRQKAKLYAVTEKSIPNADVYDSDSNQSMDTNKNRNTYIVTEKSLPSTDVYESDSNLSECAKEIPEQIQNKGVKSSDATISQQKPSEQLSKTSKNNESSVSNDTRTTISIDLTGNESFVSLNDTGIQESIIMGNVSGFTEYEDYGDVNLSDDISKFGSTNIPSILNENLDFDNLKGIDRVCKRRTYSLTTLRAEMEKFYNESWGGENFNHREIQKSMSRDKSLWVIDPKDRVPSLVKRKITCNYCNRAGHRDDTCRMKPPVCYMCGSTGHFEPRCPRKICVNCGSPNQMYSNMCRNCSNWGALRCMECGQNGHPASHCPDLWRRYHNTIDNNSPLERCNQNKKHYQHYCSGCTRRGHLVHTCRFTLPFSGLPINTPYVCLYRPLHPPAPNNQAFASAPATPRNERNKRQSKSPTTHETHVNKKRNLSAGDEIERRSAKSPAPQRKTSVSKEAADETNKTEAKKRDQIDNKGQGATDKAPNFIPISSSTNHDKKGNMIQDNEISSDSNEVVASARIYITNEMIDKLKSEEGKAWLRAITEKHCVEVENAEINYFLSIKGKLEDQEAFQTELRDWFKPNAAEDRPKPSSEGDTQHEHTNEQNAWSILPKNRNNLLRQLNNALNSLKEDIGDPSALYKELTFLQNRHQQLLKQKVISPKQLNNNRCNINQMLKKLNMVLIGQAGLADGTAHITELYSFQEKLINSRQKTIPNDVRKEIAQHYALIFTALPRNDYLDLLKMYHMSKQSTVLMRRKKKKALKLNPKLNRLKIKVNSIPTQPIQNGIKEKREEPTGPCSDPHTMQKLAFYHRRLMSSRPAGAALKKTRGDLVRRLHSSIASLFRKEKMSSKNMKKVRKLQEQAQMFLSNV